MYILVINSGSSSIKYQLFLADSDSPVCKGLVDRIGQSLSRITHEVSGLDAPVIIDEPIPDHETGMRYVAELLVRADIAVLNSPGDISTVGHRVVHGGESLTKTTLITESVKEKIKSLYPLAPLHNPGHMEGILVTEKLFPSATQVAVFDTAFHQTLPEKAFRYAIPAKHYTEDGVRVYGFHGISHAFVSREAMNFIGRDDAKIITIHLGNGCSMAAVDAGICIDTSMGMTPLDGLVMGTRSGTIDASVLSYLADRRGVSLQELSGLLNKESGMLGLTGYSDMRDVGRLYDEGNAAARLAYQLYAYRIKKFIGAYAAALNGLDAIVFTAGVGENDALARALVCEDLGFLGIRIDTDKNSVRQKGIRDLTGAEGRVRILVVPTNEELAIAREARDLTAGKKGA